MAQAAYNGHRIRLARKRAGLTQAQLGDLIGLSASAIGMYEQGRRKPGTDILILLCNTLDASPAWLLGKGRDNEQHQAIIAAVIDDAVARLRR